MYLHQSSFIDFISGIRLAINIFLWFFKYKKYVIISVLYTTESGNDPSSPNIALFTDVLTPTSVCRISKEIFLWYNLVYLIPPNFR